MEHVNKLDFTGQSIYVGLDVHKKSWSVSIHSEQCEHRTFNQPPEPDMTKSSLGAGSKEPSPEIGVFSY